MKEKRIAHFLLLEEIGSGSTGSVYKAKDEQLNRFVAVKLFENYPQQDAPHLLARETSASNLYHAHVGVIHSVGKTRAGIPYIVMPLYASGSLKRRMPSYQENIDLAIETGRQIALGMAALHTAGIIHKDLKPGNILFSDDGAVKIVDFGISRAIDDKTRTRAGGLRGTCEYMSPEQVHDAEIDERSDIWSLGVLLYEMLSGETPFHAGSEAAVLSRILHEYPEPLQRKRSWIPADAATLVHRCLQKDRSFRPQTMDEIVEALEGLQVTKDTAPRLHKSWGPKTSGRTLLFVEMGFRNTATKPHYEAKKNELRTILFQDNGILIRETNTSLVAEFPNPKEALQCAIHLQETKRQVEEKEHRISLQIGIHTTDGSLPNQSTGDLLKIVSGMLQVTSPDEICISSPIMKELQGLLHGKLHKTGKARLSEFGIDVERYRAIAFRDVPFFVPLYFFVARRWVWLLVTTVSIVIVAILIRDTISVPVKPIKLLAALPLQQTSDTPEYLTTGLTQVLINCLSQLPDIKVISSYSVSRFADRTLNLDDIREELHADGVLTGSLSMVGETFSSKLSLYDARTGKRLRFFEEEGKGLSNFVPTVTRQVSEELALPLNPEMSRRIDFYAPTHQEAFSRYLHGIYENRKGTMQSNKLAIAYLKQTLAMDSTFVPALNYLAYCQQVRYEQGWETNDAVLAEAASYCTRALRLDSLNADARAILGTIETIRNNPTRGQSLSLEALLYDPNNLAALTNMGVLNIYYLDKFADGVTYFKRVQELEPLSAYGYNNLAVGYIRMGNFPEAYVMLRHALAIDSARAGVWLNLGDYYTHEAKDDSALLCYRTVTENHPLERRAYERMGTLYLAIGEAARAKTLLTRGANLLPGDYGLIYLLGRACLGSGDSAKARGLFQQGLALIRRQLGRQPRDGYLLAMRGVFEARLGQGAQARVAAQHAKTLDSLDSDVLITVARVHAILGDHEGLVDAFRRARKINSEYDVASLRTALDFDGYRNDIELLSIAREEDF